MEYLYAALLIIFLLFGLAAIPLGLPGTFVILAAAFLYALVTGFAKITWGTLAILLVAALLAEAVEAVAGVIGARRYGSGTLGVVLSVVGGIAGAVIGAPILFGLGSIPGALLGAFGGAVLAEFLGGRSSSEALRAGWGTFLGRLAGTAVKAAVGVVMAALCLQRILA